MNAIKIDTPADTADLHKIMDLRQQSVEVLEVKEAECVQIDGEMGLKIEELEDELIFLTKYL